MCGSWRLGTKRLQCPGVSWHRAQCTDNPILSPVSIILTPADDVAASFAVPGWFVTLIARSVSPKDESDAVCRHYAAKMTENLLSQSGALCHRLITQVSDALVRT